MKKERLPKKTSEPSIRQVLAELDKRRTEILALPSEKAMDAILSAPRPAALVHSIQPTDLFFLVQDIGPEDALPVLSLASDGQWELMLDMGVWQGDRVQIRSLTRWLHLRFLADPDRFLRWFRNDEREFVEWYLYKTIEIRVLQPDEDPSDIPDAFTTLDNTVYYRFLPEFPQEPTSDDGSDASGADEERYGFINRFLEKLHAEDPTEFLNVMLETGSVQPAEIEDESWRIRNVRMAEKGFLPFDEAIGIYQPLKPHQIPKRVVSAPKTETPVLPVPSYARSIPEMDSHFVRSLKLLEPDELISEIHLELASLVNQLVVADRKKIESRSDIQEVVKKALGYLSIGLERLSDSSPPDWHRGAALIRTRMLSGIFRVGYGAALELKWQARQWVKESWFKANKLPLAFWGEARMGVLGGLLLKKPLFFDNYETGVLYREFQSMADIRSTRRVLDRVIQLDRTLGAMAGDLAVFLQSVHGRIGLNYKNLILTSWAQSHIGLDANHLPIPMEQFIPFYRELFEKSTQRGAASPGKIPKTMKSSFLNWFSEKTGMAPRELTDRCGPELDGLFEEVEGELGSVSEADLNPRYLQLFFVGP